MQRIQQQQVACPDCEEHLGVPVPDSDTELTVSRWVGAFGEQTELTCSEGHTFWVSYC